MEFKEVIAQGDTSISSYGDGGFRIGAHRTVGSLLITPKGYYPWSVGDKDQLTLDSLELILDQRQDIDILLIGMGDNMSFLNKQIRSALEEANIGVDVMAPGAAARTYNVLLMEGRKVAAALIAVE